MSEDPAVIQMRESQSNAIATLNALIAEEEVKYLKEVQIGVTKRVDAKDQ